MKSILKIQSMALVLLLLCSVCVVPVMAGSIATSGSTVIEDGVHLVKFADSPTMLDPHFYTMIVGDNFVVDGNQYYWVRIGNVKAAALSSNDQIRFICDYGMAAVGVAAGIAVGGVATSSEVGSLGAATPVVVPLYGIAYGLVIGGAITASCWCPIVEKWFVDNKFRTVSSDGTILMMIRKDNTPGIQGLKQSSIDINKLTHLTQSGHIIKEDT